MDEYLLVDILYQNEFFVPYLKQLKKYLKANPRVLDFGCRMGYNTKKMKDLGCEVVGIDSNENNINIAKEKNNDISFFKENLLNNLKHLGEFAGVLFIGSLEEYNLNELETIFSNVYDILEENGYILIINRNKNKNINNTITTKSALIEFVMESKFTFIEELAGDMSWNFSIYKKNTIK